MRGYLLSDNSVDLETTGVCGSSWERTVTVAVICCVIVTAGLLVMHISCLEKLHSLATLDATDEYVGNQELRVMKRRSIATDYRRRRESASEDEEEENTPEVLPEVDPLLHLVLKSDTIDPQGLQKGWGPKYLPTMLTASSYSDTSGNITVAISGLYNVYAQITYATAVEVNRFHIYYTRNGTKDPIASCITGALRQTQSHRCKAEKNGVERSCYTASVVYLKQGDQLQLNQSRPEETLCIHSDDTFWGLLCLDCINSVPNTQRKNELKQLARESYRDERTTMIPEDENE